METQYKWLRMVYDCYKALYESQGSNDVAPVVIDGDKLINDTESQMSKLCSILGIDSSKIQYSWDAADKFDSKLAEKFIGTIGRSTGVIRQKDYRTPVLEEEAENWAGEWDEKTAEKMKYFAEKTMEDYQTGVRSAYTEKDDNHLVEYMAMFASEKGRTGNNLYKQMVDNLTGNSPWAGEHSWQSWRDRYKKNSDYFDKRIRIYKKRHGISTSSAGGKEDKVEEGSKKRKRVSIAAQDEVTIVKKPKVVKKSEPKGREAAVDDNPQLHLFVSISQIPRRHKGDADRGEGPSRRPGEMPVRAVASSSNASQEPARKSQSAVVPQRTITAPDGHSPGRAKSPSTSSRLPMRSPPSTQPAQKEGSIQARAQKTSKLQQMKTKGDANKVNKEVTDQDEDDADDDQVSRDGQSPLFTQRVEDYSPPRSPLFTQAVGDEDIIDLDEGDGKGLLGEDSDGEDDSMVNHLLTDPIEVEESADESGEEHTNLYPLLDSPHRLSQVTKPSGPSRQEPMKKQTTSSPATYSARLPERHPLRKDRAAQRLKPKQPPKYAEGPFRVRLVAPTAPGVDAKQSSSESDSDAAELLPIAGRKRSAPVKKQSIPTSSKTRPVHKASRESESNSSSASSTPTPPRKRPRAGHSDSGKAVNNVGHHVDVADSDHVDVEDRSLKGGVAQSDGSQSEEEMSTEPEDEDGEVHPFDRLSHPPRTPHSCHPFDLPQSQAQSNSSIRSHVSERDMDKVIKVLERFISKLDTDRRERFLDRSQVMAKEEQLPQDEEDQDGDMVLDHEDDQPQMLPAIPKGKETKQRADLRDRGSPLPTKGPPKESGSQKPTQRQTSLDEETLPQSSAGGPPTSSPPVPHSEPIEDVPVAEVKIVEEDVRPIAVDEEHVQEAPIPQDVHRIVSLDKIDADTQMSTFDSSAKQREDSDHLLSGHDSLFSTSSFPQKSSYKQDKGKGKAVDPFVRLNREDSRHRRHSSTAEGVTLPQLDLRLLHRARRRSLPSRSSASSVSAGSSAGGSRPIVRKFVLEKPVKIRLSEHDQTRLVEMNVERMAAEYDFPASVVLKVWNECGDIAETESILAKLKTQFEGLMDQARKRRSSVGLNASFQMPSSRIPTPPTPPGMIRTPDIDTPEHVSGPSTSQTHSRSTASPRRSTASPRRSTQSKRNSPQFTPTLVREDDIPASDYSPPVGSRAGKFVRLRRQGRLQEALDRETRRASGGRTSLKGSGT
ncbi:hypothetical protein PQX77_015319 [Marasmius sp. AFHP31]|nr:hypothetical protein PQX77_015319 [Marasmius sp. AFHP31]